jgi:hypothetical protein
MAGQVAAIVVENYRVEHGEGFTLPVITLTDRRAAGNRLVRFVFQRHLEAVLFGRMEGSSGPIWKLMNRAGIGSTALSISKPTVSAGVITEDEYNAIMRVFKDSLPSEMVDPSSLGRIRCCTALPLAAAATVARSFGRSAASMALLRAVSQPVPQAWELREEQEANAAEGVVDLLLNEQLDEQGFEAEEMSFAQELMTMPAFSADADDETRLKTYTLTRVPPLLKSELEQYTLHRTATFAARRQGGAVQSISAETDCNALLRFYGWMAATHRADVGGDFSFMLRQDLGDITQEYASWLQNTQQCKFSTIASECPLSRLPSPAQCPTEARLVCVSRLPERLGEHLFLCLFQHGAERCAACHGAQPADAADQPPRAGGEGEQDAAALRKAHRRLARVAAGAGGARVRHGQAQRAAIRRVGGEALPPPGCLRPLAPLADPSRSRRLHPQAPAQPHAQAQAGRRLGDGPEQAARRAQDLALLR